MTVREEDRSLYRRRSSVRTIRECITVNKRSLYINSGAAERIALHTRSVCFETRADNDWLRSLRNLETRYLFTLADLREEGCVIKNDAREHGIAYRLENWKNTSRNHVICFVPRIFLQTSPGYRLLFVSIFNFYARLPSSVLQVYRRDTYISIANSFSRVANRIFN